MVNDVENGLLDEIASAMVERAGFYRMLSSVFFKEASAEFIEALSAQSAGELPEGSLLSEGYSDLMSYLARRGPDARTDLAVDYARVFLAAGIYEGEAANPYESIYTSEERLIMQDARDEVRRTYILQGVNVNEGLNLPEDHLSFECEFMAIMSDRAYDLARRDEAGRLKDNLGVQLGFLESHLLNWLPDLQDKVEAVARKGFYPAFLKITLGYAREDAALIGEYLELMEARP